MKPGPAGRDGPGFILAGSFPAGSFSASFPAGSVLARLARNPKGVG